MAESRQKKTRTIPDRQSFIIERNDGEWASLASVRHAMIGNVLVDRITLPHPVSF
jgi:hypothetical protein